MPNNIGTYIAILIAVGSSWGFGAIFNSIGRSRSKVKLFAAYEIALLVYALAISRILQVDWVAALLLYFIGPNVIFGLGYLEARYNRWT